MIDTRVTKYNKEDWKPPSAKKIPYATSRLISSTTSKYMESAQISYRSKLADLDFDPLTSPQVDDDTIGLPIHDLLLMFNRNIICHNRLLCEI